MLAQILYLFFVLFVEVIIFDKYRRKETSVSNYLFWATLWIVSTVLLFVPKSFDYIAFKLGLKTQKGVDLVLDAAVVFMFYMVGRVFVKLEKMERQITKVTRAISYESRDKETSDNNSHL